jgi:hypothetical protein
MAYCSAKFIQGLNGVFEQLRMPYCSSPQSLRLQKKSDTAMMARFATERRNIIAYSPSE